MKSALDTFLNLIRKPSESSPLRFVWEIVYVFLDRSIARSAAALAYFLLFSIFPFIIMLNSILGLLHLDTTSVFHVLENALPPQIAGLVADYLIYITENQSNAMLIAGLALMLTMASAAFRTLISASNDIYRKKAFTTVFHVLISFAFSLLLLIVLYLSLVVLLTGSWFFHLIQEKLGLSIDTASWGWMRFLVFFLLMFLFLASFFRATLPRAKCAPTPSVLPGAFLASVAIVAVSIIFAMFIGLSSKYSLVYGSLASLIILMFWLYLLGNVILLGSVFNYVLFRHRLQKSEGTPSSKDL